MLGYCHSCVIANQQQNKITYLLFTAPSDSFW